MGRSAGSGASGSRPTSRVSANAPCYRTGSYANAGFRIDYTLVEGVATSVGMRNIFDSNYLLVDGFPEQGRSVFLSLRARYRQCAFDSPIRNAPKGRSDFRGR